MNRWERTDVNRGFRMTASEENLLLSRWANNLSLPPHHIPQRDGDNILLMSSSNTPVKTFYSTSKHLAKKLIMIVNLSKPKVSLTSHYLRCISHRKHTKSAGRHQPACPVRCDLPIPETAYSYPAGHSTVQ